MMLHTKYQGSMLNGIQQEDLFMFSLFKLNMTPGRGQGHHLNKLGRGYISNIKALVL